jgi:hypothetical protein
MWSYSDQILLEKAKQVGRPCYLVRDAPFAVKTSFLIFAQALNESGEQWVRLITRAKTNFVADWRPPDRDHDASTKWEKDHLMDVFDFSGKFYECQSVISGKPSSSRTPISRY